jgi:Xaa-Pro aminopeptidase
LRRNAGLADLHQWLERVMGSMYFPQEEYENRWQAVLDEMARRDLDAALIWSRGGGTYERFQDVYYLSNFYSTQSGFMADYGNHVMAAHCAILLKQGAEPVLIIDDEYWNPDLVSVPHVIGSFNLLKAVVQAVKESGLKGKVGFVGSDFLGVKYFRMLEKQLPGIEWEDHNDLVADVRVIKSERELDALREAGETASLAMNALMEAIQAGKSENQAGGEAARVVYSRGGHINLMLINHGPQTAEEFTSNPICGHGFGTPKQGDIVRAWVYGAMHQGYWTDPGRTTVVGLNPSADQKRLIETCATIVTETMNAIRPGVHIDEIVAMGNRMRDEFGGVEDQMSARWPIFGHGNGLFWDWPMVASEYEGKHTVYRKNMVGSTETFLALPGVGGAGFEQNFIVTEGGTELITKTPMLWW